VKTIGKRVRLAGIVAAAAGLCFGFMTVPSAWAIDATATPTGGYTDINGITWDSTGDNASGDTLELTGTGCTGVDDGTGTGGLTTPIVAVQVDSTKVGGELIVTTDFADDTVAGLDATSGDWYVVVPSLTTGLITVTAICYQDGSETTLNTDVDLVYAPVDFAVVGVGWDEGTTGDDVSTNGYGFTPLDGVTYTLTGNGVDIVVGQGTVGDDGTYTTTMNIPTSVATGTYTITVADQSGRSWSGSIDITEEPPTPPAPPATPTPPAGMPDLGSGVD